MAVTTTKLFDPPLRGAIADAVGKVTKSFQNWLFSIQNQFPLILIDTTSGNVVQALPAAGLSATTGQSNQNQELIYRKISADANTVTINGSFDGAQVLTSNTGAASRVRFKSDGTNWYVVG
jgi:hypothetical protein